MWIKIQQKKYGYERIYNSNTLVTTGIEETDDEDNPYRIYLGVTSEGSDLVTETAGEYPTEALVTEVYKEFKGFLVGGNSNYFEFPRVENKEVLVRDDKNKNYSRF